MHFLVKNLSNVKLICVFLICRVKLSTGKLRESKQITRIILKIHFLISMTKVQIFPIAQLIVMELTGTEICKLQNNLTILPVALFRWTESRNLYLSPLTSPCLVGIQWIVTTITNFNEYRVDGFQKLWKIRANHHW